MLNGEFTLITFTTNKNMIDGPKKNHLKMIAQQQLKKKFRWRYATCGPSLRFFAVALRRRLRAHAKLETCKKTKMKPSGRWTITLDSPLEKVCANMDPFRFPHLVYRKLLSFNQSSCAALALAGSFDGFSDEFKESRRLNINEQCFYFTPTSFSFFIDQHINLAKLKIFSINHVYWLPGELLFNTILNMPKLEEMSIKGTQVCTLRQVAKILQSCPMITKVDFTYTEKTVEELEDGLRRDNISLDSWTEGFERLTSIKLATTVPDPQHDVFKDPWHLIINKILCFCRDCTDLKVEITYTAIPESSRKTSDQNWEIEEQENETILESLRPKLKWMKSLESLVLIKLGTYATEDVRVYSILLKTLLNILFFSEENCLRVLWVQDFEVDRCGTLQYLSHDILQSYGFGDYDGSESEDENGSESEDEKEQYEPFINMVHLGGTYAKNFSLPLPSLKKLKYVSGTSTNDEKFYQFCKKHPKLEYLSVRQNSLLSCLKSKPVNDTLCKLPKLKLFSCDRIIRKEFVEAMTDAYPIVEYLLLKNSHLRSIPSDHKSILSAFRFPHLTSLSLSGFQLLDGAALLPIIKECPKLRIVHLDTDSLDPVAFALNLELFASSATKLRDFRLVFKQREDNGPPTAYSILKALLKGSLLLERVALIDGGSEKLVAWKHPPEFADFLVDFNAKMTHLTCCCLTFNKLDVDLMKAIKERVEEEVVTDRPSLWFYMDRSLPEASDEGVPSIHYHQMVKPISFVMPRF